MRRTSTGRTALFRCCRNGLLCCLAAWVVIDIKQPVGFRASRDLPSGTDVTLIANGVLVVRALEAAETLAAQGISARVLNASSMAPFDRTSVVCAAKETR